MKQQHEGMFRIIRVETHDGGMLATQVRRSVPGAINEVRELRIIVTPVLRISFVGDVADEIGAAGTEGGAMRWNKSGRSCRLAGAFEAHPLSLGLTTLDV